MASGRVVVVTGGNKGIGLEIVKKVLTGASENDVTVLAARDQSRGNAAVEELKAQGLPSKGLQFRLLDVASEDSVKTFCENLEKDFGKLDVLVNNAAIAFKSSDPTPFKDQAAPTMKVNFFGTVNLTENALPLLKKSEHPRIVNVASRIGSLGTFTTDLMKKKISSEDLSKEELMDIAREFVTDVSGEKPLEEKGWPRSCYGFSKAVLIAYTRVLARELGESARVNACCPGYCKTDMTSQNGIKMPEDGARTPFMLTTIPDDGPTGKFLGEERELEW